MVTLRKRDRLGGAPRAVRTNPTLDQLRSAFYAEVERRASATPATLGPASRSLTAAACRSVDLLWPWPQRRHRSRAGDSIRGQLTLVLSHH